MYKANRESNSAADSDDDSAFGTMRRMLLQSAIRPRAGAQGARQLRSPQSQGASDQHLDHRPRLHARADNAARRPTASSEGPAGASRGAGCPCNVLLQASIGGPRTGKPRGPRAIAALHGARTRGGLCNGTQTSDAAGHGNRTKHAQLRTPRRTAPRQGLPIPPSRLRATCLMWASRVPTSLASSRPRATRPIRPKRPHRRRSAPYRGTSRIRPCARRQSTCALCPPRLFPPRSSGPVHLAPPRGITSKTPAGITS